MKSVPQSLFKTMLSTKAGVPDTPEVIDLDFVLSGATAKQARSPLQKTGIARLRGLGRRLVVRN